MFFFFGILAPFETWKILGKDKKINKKNDFLIFGFIVKKKSNIIKILQNLAYFLNFLVLYNKKKQIN